MNLSLLAILSIFLHFSQFIFCSSSASIFDEIIPISTPLNYRLCVHSGERLFEWPRGLCPNGKMPVEIQFPNWSLSLDSESGFVFVECRHCHNHNWAIEAKFKCADGENWQMRKFQIQTAKIGTKISRRKVSKSKRWLLQRSRSPRNSQIHFKDDKYVAEIPENAPVRTLVAQLQAHHQTDKLLYFALGVPEDSRSANLFSLDTVTGELFLAKSLDRETKEKHILKVIAYERLDPSQSAAVSVEVDVLDVQDNAPQFERNTYYGEIREDAPIGTTVLSVFARDFDDGPNGEVEYSLDNEAAFMKELFSINSKSGVIQTAAQLDHETLAPILRFKVIAADHGEPPMRNSANVEISILDVNDNAPRFEEGFSCEAKVPEDLEVPAVILRPRAEDADTDANGKVHYSIVTASAPLFSIDYATGEVTLKERPSPGRQSPLSLLVRAKDGGQPALSTTLECTLHILDVNDHSPAFIGLPIGSGHLELSVDEDAPIGQELSRMLAMDEDSGQNGEIHYRILLQEGEEEMMPFEVDEKTGMLRTKERLDREKNADYEFVVLAEDGGIPARNATINVRVRVKDVNDNTPAFPKLLYEMELSEDTPRGHGILSLKAIDLDEGDDHKLVYKIEQQIPATENGELFALTPSGLDQGALLSLTRQFSPSDRNFSLTISATDQNGLKGHCNVTIKIKDVNRPPQFVPHPFTVRIPENVPVGSAVLQMVAKDEDYGQNSEMEFSLDSKEFGIDPHSGLITVRQQLDREQQPLFTVDVRVQDKGEPPLASATVLEIALEDVNDNAPRFLSEQYQASIPEDIPVGTSFLQIQARDPDEGPNGLIDFFLDQEDAFVKMDKFRLDRTSGTLRVNRPLDRENVSEYTLPVIARDRGVPEALLTRSLIQVALEDVNDNAPKFEMPGYDFWLAENSPEGTLVGQLRASDADQGENGEIKFKIFGGADAKFFELDQEQGDEPGTVRIKTRNQFDFEASQNKFTLELQASSGQLSSIVSVRIHISDVNDHPPQLADPFVVLIGQYIMGDDDGEEEARQNLTIGTVPAFDPDQNATLEFGMEENGLLALDPVSGQLSLKQTNWHGQIDAEYKVCVSDGPNTVCSRAQINFVPTFADTIRTSAVSILLPAVSRDEFLSPLVFQRFRQAISTLWDWALPENIRIFGIQEDKNAGTIVNFFVSGNQDEPMELTGEHLDKLNAEESATKSAWRVEQAIIEYASNLSQLFGSPIQLILDDICAKEPCPYFQSCRTILRYLGTNETYATDDFLMRGLATTRAHGCECPRGFTTNHSLPGECNQRLNLCFEAPCIHGGICHPLENGYRCECQNGWTGSNCELSAENVETCLPNYCLSGSKCQLQRGQRKLLCIGCPWHPADTDARCTLRSLSFGGDSFLAFPKAPSRMDWELRLTIATISSSGTLIYSGINSADQGNGDFLHLYLEAGIPSVRFSLGQPNNTIHLTLPDSRDNRVNDGEWHTLHLEYHEWKMRLSIDNCDMQSAILLGHLGHQCAAEVLVNLPKKCLQDRAVPCRRFLNLPPLSMIGGIDGRHGKEKIHSSFIGVIKDVHLDGILFDFSKWEQLERNGINIWPGSTKFRPDNCSLPQNSPCSPQSKCIDRWLGHHCRCPLRVHSPGHNCSSLQIGQELPAVTISDDSYVLWRLPERTIFPAELYFEFRTRERKTQVMALEFDVATQLLLFSIESGQALVQLNGEQYLLPYPPLSDGNWHSVKVQFDTNLGVELAVDELYKKQISPRERLSTLSPALALYSGTVPSSSHPAPFLGCIRNVEWSGQKLAIGVQSGTRSGCLAPNQCNFNAGQNQCPENSRCIRDWDRHQCKCNLGYVGDNCLDVCSLSGICGKHGICVATSNSSTGYECICPEGWNGSNCQRQSVPNECPPEWFGQFPHCKRCDCSKSGAGGGFRSECHPRTGECTCPEGTFLNKDWGGRGGHSCRPCQCGYGTVPGFEARCDPTTGQCQCAGEAMGQKCDRCPVSVTGSKKQFYQLERYPLECVPIEGRCPSELASGIQWPTTAVGITARHACAPSNQQMGIATRRCEDGGEWAGVSEENCTITALHELRRQIEESATTDSTQKNGLWAQQLANISEKNEKAMMRGGRNHQLALTTLLHLIEQEIEENKNDTKKEKSKFNLARNILRIADSLLTHGDDGGSRQICVALAKYGQHLVKVQREAKFIAPFQFKGWNLAFGVRQLNGRALSKGLKFWASGRPRRQMFLVEIFPPYGGGQSANPPSNPIPLFYLAAIGVPEMPMGAIYLPPSTSAQMPEVKITTRIDSQRSQLAPECYQFFANNLSISHSNNELKQLENQRKMDMVHYNGTHMTCRINWPITEQQFDGPIIFAFQTNRSDEARKMATRFLLFSSHWNALHSSPITIASGFCVIFAFGLIALTLGIAAFRNAMSQSTTIRLPIIIAFMLNAIFLTASHRILLNDTHFYCPTMNSLLLLTTSSLFAWLFLFSLQIYKNLVQGSAGNACSLTSIFLGILLPLLLAIAEFYLSIFLDKCTGNSIRLTKFWSNLLAPIIFCLLTFYSLATSWLLSWQKHLDLLLSPSTLRYSLLYHFILVILCAIHSAFGLFTFWHAPMPSVQLLAGNALLLAFTSIYIFLWANFLPINPFASASCSSVAGGDNRSAESMWMAKDRDNDQVVRRQQRQPLLMYPDCAAGNKHNNIYANSLMIPSLSPYQKQIIQGHKIYEGVPNEWIPPGSEDCANYAVDGPTYLHHTLQRSLMELPRILTPPRAPPATEIDGNQWQSDFDPASTIVGVDYYHHNNASSTMPNSTFGSPMRRPPILEEAHYGSVRLVNPARSIKSTPNLQRRRTQPVIMQITQEMVPNGGRHGSPRSGAKIDAALDDELNSAYFTFKRRRESEKAAMGSTILQQDRGSPQRKITTTTTFN